MSTKSKIAKASVIVIIGSALSVILGFLREASIASRFGKNIVTDSYLAAVLIPNMFYFLLIGGSLNVSFIPVFTEYLINKGEKEAWIIASTIGNIILIILVTMTVVGIIAATPLTHLIVPGFRPESIKLCSNLTKIVLPAIIFIGIAGLLSGILYSYKYFTVPAFSAVVFNIIMVISIYTLGKKTVLGIRGVAIGMLLGMLGQFILQAVALIKKRNLYKLVIDFNHPGVRKIGKLMLPAVIMAVFTQTNLVIERIMASGLKEGSISALNYARLLSQVPQRVFSLSIATAIFPTLSTQAAQKQVKALKDTISVGIRMIVFITVPAAVAFISLATPMIRLLYQRGAFHQQDTQITATALTYYAVGLFALGISYVVIRGYSALQDMTTPLIVGAIAVILNIIFNLLLVKPLAHGGLALGFSLSCMMQAFLLIGILKRRLGNIDGLQIIRTSIKVLLASIIMGFICFLVANNIGERVNLTKSMGRLIQVSSACIIGLVVYLVAAFLLKFKEANLILDLAEAKFKFLSKLKKIFS